eukprot:CAMPEP_0183708976 /NCGR_PEP_ID=MMETSP0737-20130205/5128_1 /TAXON_ID=385413 /ORGANISM="Thalassiosira miniscula, Strain CCMP1093" /LENGTH=79 /DNA_ID=CAMNT_0025936955 /DNA_START=41 /DNA_END=280 /DNA_ORIENTATION=-
MATIQSRFNSMLHNTAEYYRPLFRSGSVKPLWHIMIATGVIMYTQNYIFNKGAHVQAARKEQKLALEEYYEKHGKSGHH